MNRPLTFRSITRRATSPSVPSAGIVTARAPQIAITQPHQLGAAIQRIAKRALADRAQRGPIRFDKRGAILLQHVKLEPRIGLAFGFLFVCKDAGVDYFDLHDDNIPEDEVIPAAHYFAKRGGAGDVMHDEDVVASCPFIWPVTSEVNKAMEMTSRFTGLAIAWEPDDKALLTDIDSGDKAAFSLQGLAFSEEV